MYFFDYLTLSFKNICKRKLRFLLCVLSISVGITTVVFITSAGKSGLESINGELAKMGFNCGVIQVKEGSLKTKDILSLQNYLNDDFYTSTVVKLNGEIKDKNRELGCVVYGGDEEILPVFGYNIIYGRALRLNDLINQSKTVIIDSNLSKKLFGKENSVGSYISVDVMGNTEEFRVVGITDSSSVKSTIDDIPSFIFVPHTTVQKSGISKTVYALPRVGNYERKKITDILEIINKEEKVILECRDMNSYKENINYILNTITIILSLIGAISFIAGGLGVVNTMMITVSERKKEIGIKKALGQSDFSVIAELIAEAVITMSVACIAGVIAGLLISKVSLGYAGVEFIPDYNSVLNISTVSVVMGILFGFFPAIKTFFMNPVDILK